MTDLTSSSKLRILRPEIDKPGADLGRRSNMAACKRDVARAIAAFQKTFVNSTLGAQEYLSLTPGNRTLCMANVFLRVISTVEFSRAWECYSVSQALNQRTGLELAVMQVVRRKRRLGLLFVHTTCFKK